MPGRATQLTSWVARSAFRTPKTTGFFWDADRASAVLTGGGGLPTDELSRCARLEAEVPAPHTPCSASRSHAKSGTGSCTHDRGTPTRQQHAPRGGVPGWSPSGHRVVTKRIPRRVGRLDGPSPRPNRLGGSSSPRAGSTATSNFADDRLDGSATGPLEWEAPTGPKPTFRTTGISDAANPPMSQGIGSIRVGRTCQPCTAHQRRLGADRGPDLLTSLAEQTILIDLS
jgi:hypothetical protein